MEISFLVQGSAKEPYLVRFINRGGGNISAYCTCPAGENGMYCKHRTRIITGDTEGIVGGNVPLVKDIQRWIVGSNIEKAMAVVQEREKDLANAKKLLSQAKKEVAKAMMD